MLHNAYCMIRSIGKGIHDKINKNIYSNIKKICIRIKSQELINFSKTQVQK